MATSMKRGGSIYCKQIQFTKLLDKKNHMQLDTEVTKAVFLFPVPPLGQEPNVGVFIEEHKKRADCDPNAPPFDDLRNYAYEGGGSTAGSLSSLASGTHTEPQVIDFQSPTFLLIYSNLIP